MTDSGTPNGAAGTSPQDQSAEDERTAYEMRLLTSLLGGSMLSSPTKPQTTDLSQAESSKGSDAARVNLSDKTEAQKKQAKETVEYYFSAANLCRDKFLQSIMDKDGWVSLDNICGFPRMVRLGFDGRSLAELLEGSPHVELSQDKSEVRTTFVPTFAALLPAQRNEISQIAGETPSESESDQLEEPHVAATTSSKKKEKSSNKADYSERLYEEVVANNWQVYDNLESWDGLDRVESPDDQHHLPSWDAHGQQECFDAVDRFEAWDAHHQSQSWDAPCQLEPWDGPDQFESWNARHQHLQPSWQTLAPVIPPPTLLQLNARIQMLAAQYVAQHLSRVRLPATQPMPPWPTMPQHSTSVPPGAFLHSAQSQQQGYPPQKAGKKYARMNSRHHDKLKKEKKPRGCEA